MKTYQNAGILFLATFVFINVSTAEDSEFLLFSHPSNGDLKTNVWMVSLDTLKKAPQWKMGEGEPPLSLGKAIELARNWIISRGCDTNSWVREVTVRPVYPMNGEYQHICHYNILFGGVGIYGHYRRCIMLMDGTILEPKWAGAGPKYPSDYRVYDE